MRRTKRLVRFNAAIRLVQALMALACLFGTPMHGLNAAEDDELEANRLQVLQLYHQKAAEIDSIIRDADKLIEAKDWLHANALIVNGIEALDDNYIFHNYVEETFTKLIDADEFERNGNLADAVKLRRRMLGYRVQLMRFKIDTMSTARSVTPENEEFVSEIRQILAVSKEMMEKGDFPAAYELLKLGNDIMSKKLPKYYGRIDGLILSRSVDIRAFSPRIESKGIPKSARV